MEVKSNIKGGVPPDGSVTNVKLASMATKTYKGRTSATTGVPEDVAVATLKTDMALTKADVGLGSVDNTADTAKPVSTAQQTALDLKAPITIIQALGVKNADFTVDIANGAYATVTTGSAAVAMTLTSPASSTNSYKLTVAILQGATPRVVTLKAADANVISSGGLMSSGDALPNSGANTLDVFEFEWMGTKWETCDARYDVKA